MSIAPPGCTSSAGWKISRTRPGSDGALASASPAPEHHRGVRVVAAGVHHVRHGRGERQPGGLVQRKGVDVGAQGDAALAAADVADQADAAGQGARLQSGRGQQVRRPARWCGARPGPAPARRAAHGARRRPRTGAAPATSPATRDHCPRPCRRPRARRYGTTDASFSRTVTGPHRPSTLRGASAHTPHPDGGVPSRYDLLARTLAKGLPICCGRAHGRTNGRPCDDERDLPPFVAPT